MKSKLEMLRADYAQVKGQPSTHFYCPILFKDEDVLLCQAHIINKAFRNSPRAWTVQRSDVDNFYGCNSEADFIAIQYRTENWSPGEVITDKRLSSQFRPRIRVDDKQVEHFPARNRIPEDYTQIEIENSGKSVQLGLKIHPRDFTAAIEQNWEIKVNKDVRVPALVSLIEAAHLTLFEMMGYRYALSAGGTLLADRFWVSSLGKTIVSRRLRFLSKRFLSFASSLTWFDQFYRVILIFKERSLIGSFLSVEIVALFRGH